MKETILVERLLSNGFGMGRTQSGAIAFIPGSLPGERVRVTSMRKRKGVFWADEHERLENSPQRVEPACPHFDRCGGCDMLHLARDSELDWKGRFLEDGLRRIAKLEPPEIRSYDFPIAQSRIRGKFHVDPPGHIGFLDGQSHRITAVPHCLVLPRSVRDLLPSLAEATGTTGFRGDLFFATDERGERPVLEWAGAFAPGFRHSQAEIPGTGGTLLREGNGKRPTVLGNPRVMLTWNRFRAALEPSRFFQSNPASWPRFFEWVDRYLSLFQPGRVWDVHAGAGFLTSCLAGREVWASEPEPAARRQLARNLKREIPTSRLFSGTAEQALSDPGFSVGDVEGILLDPPRSGLSRTLVQWLADHGPASILYFACDIGSFCRDVGRLSETYQIVPPLLAMNLNPGTLRLEVGAILKRVRR